MIGSPGVGKSRLAAELTRRAKGVTTLWGRCLSYGEGITYWPLREALEQADESDERDAVLAALDAETPPPAPELAWLFRRFCEASARERPLVLVFDDVHWAEPTFLELVEHLADKGDGADRCRLPRARGAPRRPSGIPRRTRERRPRRCSTRCRRTRRTLCSTVSAETILESDQRARVVEAAEGNPLFLEQLLALALEGGLAERALPETIQALLAARLDRLGPGERAVLERGAVVGKEFTAGRRRRAARSGRGADRRYAPRRRSPAAASCGRAATARSDSGTFSCRRRSIAQRRSACARSSTSATPTGSTRSRPISPTSTSSSATTSSRRIGSGRSSARTIGARRR